MIELKKTIRAYDKDNNDCYFLVLKKVSLSTLT